MPQACADATSPRGDVASGWTGGPSGYPRCCESLSADPRPRMMVKRRTAPWGPASVAAMRRRWCSVLDAWSIASLRPSRSRSQRQARASARCSAYRRPT